MPWHFFFLNIIKRMRKMDNSIEYCPFCNSNLQGKPIPQEFRKHYGNSTHFTRKIGISSIEEDRVTKWECPDCRQQWDRD